MAHSESAYLLVSLVAISLLAKRTATDFLGCTAGKRNTSRAVFTSHERALAKSNWTSSSARLNRDSFLPFGSCGLCLEIARDPVACPRGDIFCRECALANLLAQKRELKRADKARHHAAQESARIRALEDDEERSRAIQDFEKTQAGLDKILKRRRAEPRPEPQTTPVAESSETALVEARPATKRKFALDEEELDRIARDDKAKARKAIEDEKVGLFIAVCVCSSSRAPLTFDYRPLSPRYHPSGRHPLLQMCKTANWQL